MLIAMKSLMTICRSDASPGKIDPANPAAVTRIVEENARLRLELGRERGQREEDSVLQSRQRAELAAEVTAVRREHQQALDHLAGCRRRMLMLEGQRAVLAGLAGLGGLAVMFKWR